ncbi:MAG: hypothetical protein GYB68_13275 [Chloroflexi bacterium]|nr:hypothetical protein [Chloroflexota bacterium]
MEDFTPAVGTTYPNSTVTEDGTTYFLIRLHDSHERMLGVRGNTDGFVSSRQLDDVTLCALTPHNAAELRKRLAWLNPAPVGLQTSFGFGDRLGVATPGHIDSLRQSDPSGKIAAIFAQQSVRENIRTGRTPQQVMDFAMWGVFQTGWRERWGADADHIKEVEHLAPFAQAGYTFYTIDPSDHVDSAANAEELGMLKDKLTGLAWDQLASSYDDMLARYCSEAIQLDELTLEFDEVTLARALAKYGYALVHVTTIAGALTDLVKGKAYDLEMSVDETDTPTSIYEHYFIANELIRCGVPVVSLAPRFVGKFQKGVDYIGDIDEFERDFAKHAAIMRHFGSYKLSIHTGSDKFSLYPIIAQYTAGMTHVKTAGTSYLEALRVASQSAPSLFMGMLDLAHARFPSDRKSYFLDCQPDKVPTSGQVALSELPTLLDEFHARQLLHVTYGSILDAFGEELDRLLNRHEEDYRAALSLHFQRHIKPFI